MNEYTEQITKGEENPNAPVPTYECDDCGAEVEYNGWEEMTPCGQTVCSECYEAHYDCPDCRYEIELTEGCDRYHAGKDDGRW